MELYGLWEKALCLLNGAQGNFIAESPQTGGIL